MKHGEQTNHDNRAPVCAPRALIQVFLSEHLVAPRSVATGFTQKTEKESPDWTLTADGRCSTLLELNLNDLIAMPGVR